MILACGDRFVINLPERHDRRAEFSGQLARIGLSFDHPHVHLFDAVRPPDAGPFPTIGARGCFLSHLGVLRAALDLGIDKILLCEDDLNFSRDLPARAETLVAEIERQDWDILYGFLPANVDGPAVGSTGQLVSLLPEQGFTCAHVVAFRRRAIDRLVPYLEAMLLRPDGDPEGGPMHVDGAYVWFRKAHPDLRVLEVRTGVGYQRSSMTNIAPLNARDRLPRRRHITAFARRVRNRMVPR